MEISASIKSSLNRHSVTVATNGSEKQLQIAPREAGYGSSVNGGEMLLLALATCYCNDIYREAAKRNINVESVEVTSFADFGGPGEPGSNFRYEVRVTSNASKAEIEELVRHTDEVAEIHNTLRQGVKVNLIHSHNV
ncbi:putative OsmC-like protein [Dyadobacter sp. BE34]|uniref:OsmC-like protein n=1 Tax=Dyadobacter fermentans TaxID=94254 RepID=A0ABU1R204_9BACT|nr:MULTISPECIES: OsmC family protein [Dyadobacter]MDR6807442.1 putative OsmC-like protein [Dyadobacter fermentans]MDR7045183.1 putative OsmC-like protein [Dyadobacter sp. BE242]MDR7199080.1 putative OsmC-like protein [Dyadobacter sp. BE34]MDR7217040.1 putative OsmC-like protein [Dyadobacter sp. BE31]MDR7264973.1 putative OsmC-like protein [Dyadobacter sp. BE32]